jgi:hypothetical protein
MCAPNDVPWSVAAVRTSVAKFGTYSGKLSAANSITHPETDRSQRELGKGKDTLPLDSPPLVSTFTSPRVFPPVIPDDAVVGGLGLAGHQVVRVFCCAGLILCPDLPAHLPTGLNGTQAPTRFRTRGPCRFRTDGHRCPRVPDVGDMLSKVVSDGDSLPALFNLHIWADRPPSSPPTKSCRLIAALVTIAH